MAKRYSRPKRRWLRRKKKMSDGFNPPQADNGPRQQSPDEVRGAIAKDQNRYAEKTAQPKSKALHPSLTMAGLAKAAKPADTKTPWLGPALAKSAPAKPKELHRSLTPGGVAKAAARAVGPKAAGTKADGREPPPWWGDAAAAPSAPAKLNPSLTPDAVAKAAGGGGGKKNPWWLTAAAAKSAPEEPPTPRSKARDETKRRVTDKSFWDSYKANFTRGAKALTGTSPRPKGTAGNLSMFDPGMTRAISGPVSEAFDKYNKYAGPGVEVVKEGAGKVANELRRSKKVRRRYEQTGK